MSKVALVTDSTAYIPKDLLNKYEIHVAPQVLVWGDQTFRDGVDIQPDEFYQRLEKANVMPTTSQASPKDFKEIFTRLLEEDHEVLAVLISEQLSGTIASAHQALEDMPGNPIAVVDSRTAAMALGFQVLAAARAAEDGASLMECIAEAEKAKENSGVVFAVDTLEFLHRGGRIGGATRFFGTALNIKPILEITGGRVEGLEKVRTRKKSLARLVEIVVERTKGQKSIRLAALHANAPEGAREVMNMASGQLNPIECIYSEVSPVVGTHAGPGTVGLAYMTGI